MIVWEKHHKNNLELRNCITTTMFIFDVHKTLDPDGKEYPLHRSLNTLIIDPDGKDYPLHRS